MRASMPTATTNCRSEGKTMNSMTAPEKRRRGRPAGSSNKRERTFWQVDVSRVMKAATKAGWENVKVSVDKSSGIISVVRLAPGQPVEPEGANEWDDVLKE